MNKSILLSVKPEWVAKILNKEKKIEVRKKFPKDYVGWVYIYCTKPTKNDYLVDFGIIGNRYSVFNTPNELFDKPFLKENCLNGKVVARFWCSKVDEFEWWSNSRYDDGYINEDGKNITKELCKKSCLTYEQLFEYIGGKDVGYAIHIGKLEIFYMSKNLNEYYSTICQKSPYFERKPIEKEPQNYRYIYEVKE